MLLTIENLKVNYHHIKAVDNVSFDLHQGEILGLAGESGCGKSTIGYSIMGYLPPPGRIVAGRLLFKGLNLYQHSQQLRWQEIAMVFQGAMTALNPALTVGTQIDEVLQIHQNLNKQACRHRRTQLFEMVELDPRRAKDYPHQLSGGMRQRIVIAMALACQPSLLIADEATTNLDVLTQKKLLDLLRDLQKELNLSIIFISHDLAVINQLCNRVAIVQQGKLVEIGPTETVLQTPQHPYTQRLMAAMLTL